MDVRQPNEEPSQNPSPGRKLKRPDFPELPPTYPARTRRLSPMDPLAFRGERGRIDQSPSRRLGPEGLGEPSGGLERVLGSPRTLAGRSGPRAWIRPDRRRPL